MDNGKIQYDSGNYVSTQRPQRSGGLANILIKLGVAKDEESANKVMLVILVIAIVIGVGVWFVL